MGQELRQGLSNLKTVPPAEIHDRLTELEQRHGHRRSWVWARLDRAPLALALQHIAALAEAAKSLPGATLDALAESYTAEGWKADAAMLDALAAVKTAEDGAAVRDAILT